MLNKIKRIAVSRNFKVIFFSILLWIGIYCLFKSGVIFSTNRWTNNAEIAAMGVGFLMVAILMNPFRSLFSFVSEPSSDLITFTGLEEYHWNQARSVVEKFGNEAIIKLALIESDDFLTDLQRKDFRMSRIAAELLLKVKEMNERY